jgi:hypothetical protein
MRAVSFLAALVFCTLPQMETQGAQQKMVFAHYMVCCPTAGAEAGVEDFKKEIHEAQKRGIDGFALNCGGWRDKEPIYKKRTLMIYQAALELGTDFKLFLSADFCCGLSYDEVRDMVESFRGHPNQFRFEGRPVLSTFAGGPAVSAFVKETFAGRRAIAFVPFYYPTPAVEHPQQEQVEQVFRDNPDIDGFFFFGGPGTGDQIARSNQLLAAKWRGAGKIFMAGISPFYRGLGRNYRVFETRGFESLAMEWGGAIRDGADWVELVTWNDWGEATYVAPFGPPDRTEFWNGHWGPLLAHTAYLDASRYYIDWFKKGLRPDITRDQIFYFYRLHPKGLGGSMGAMIPGKRVAGVVEKFSGDPSGANELQDKVFVSSFLTAPAELTVISGQTRQTFEVGAGVQHTSTPFAAGEQRFILRRGGRTLIDKVGEQRISATDRSTNFNYFAGVGEAVASR